MKKIITFISVFILFSVPVFSQTASFSISINNVKAAVLNGGDLFSPFVDPNGTFEVPKGSGKSTIFAAGLWIGALDAQQKLHLAASTYRQSSIDFRPGPVSDSAYQTKQSVYDKIFYITQKEIDYHRLHFADLNYTPASSITTWPGNGNMAQGEAQRLAPFIDINKNNIYEPLLGDYPLIPGDACAFAIFNDAFSKDTLQLPLGVEIHQFVYGYDDPSSVLNNTLFVSYKIFNRSNNNYTDMYVGQWIDYDIGNALDDGYCNDSSRNLMYGFNADNDDEGIHGYGLNPPAMGCLFLNQKLNKSISYNNDFSLRGNPETLQHYYNYLKGLYKDNQPIPKHSCLYDSIHNGPEDTRVLGSTNPFTLASKQEYCLTVAHIFARASSGGAQGSVDLLMQSSDFVAKYFNNKWVDDACDAYSIANGIKKSSINNNRLSIYPNPAKDKLIVKCEMLMDKNMSYTIVNVLGQILITGVIINNETAIDVSSLPLGFYFIKTEKETLKFVKR
jgi:hypothetical protein